MRFPQLILCEKTETLFPLLAPLPKLPRQPKRPCWFLRRRHQPALCLRLLRRNLPTVLVVRLGETLTDKSLERELRLLERTAWMFPDTRTVVVYDGETSALSPLIWDLGVSYSMPLVQAQDQLAEVVIGLMEAAIQVTRSGAGATLPLA